MALQQRVERVDHHLRIARAGQPPGRVAEDRVLALVLPLAQLLAQQPHQRAQALERLARLVDRLLIEIPPAPACRRSRRRAARSRDPAGRGRSAARPAATARRVAARSGARAHAGAWSSGGCARPAPGRRRRPQPRSRRAWPRAAQQWRSVQAAARPMVDGAPRGEPQAGDVPLSNLRSSSTRAQRAYADRPRRRHTPPPPRPHRVRALPPRARAASCVACAMSGCAPHRGPAVAVAAV